MQHQAGFSCEAADSTDDGVAPGRTDDLGHDDGTGCNCWICVEGILTAVLVVLCVRRLLEFQ